jgi:LuxR family maltose regulon positive regulatory protein
LGVANQDEKQAPASLDLDQVLLDAKLRVPRPHPNAVSRPALVERGRTSPCRAVGVTAAAGYGKSTFLAEWAVAEDRPVAWLALDRYDDDPTRILALLASAFSRIDPGYPDLARSIQGAGMAALGRAAPRLAAAFGAAQSPFVLMVDDLHELRSADCHDVLGIVIEGIPPGSQLVTASRFDQPHIARMRVEGEVLDIRAHDLVLDAAGAQQVFVAENVELSPEVAAGVVERTEGWPAGIYLSALVASEAGERPDAIRGDDKYVAEYLYSESLSAQSEATQQFLRQTSVLDQLSGALCSAVVPSSNGAAQLRELEQANVFVIPLDREGQWYRYHGLFREFLLNELGRTEPGQIEALHVRAADWYESEGSIALAIEHLLHTTDTHRAARLVDRLAMRSYQTGQIATSLRWLATLGIEGVEQYPPLAACAGWGAVLTGRPLEAEQWAAYVDDATFEEQPADGTSSFESARAMLRAAMCPHGPEQMLRDATSGVEREPSWSPWRNTALWLLGQAHLLLGDRDGAGAIFSEACQAATRLGNVGGVASSGAELALLAMDDEDWNRADEHVDEALLAVERSHSQDYVLSLLALAGAARRALHRRASDDARAHLARAMRGRLGATYALPYIAARLRLELATTYLALGDDGSTRQLVHEIDEILGHRPDLGNVVDRLREFRLALAPGRHAAAGATPLTSAELRVLPYLQTHLTLAGIAERLVVSRNTVNSQVSAIYRKLDVSSRNAAVERATHIGLLGD